MSLRTRCLFFVLLVAVSGSVVAQTSQPTAQPSGEPLRVGIIGASLSAGFVDPIGKPPKDKPNESMRLEKAMRSVWKRADVKFRSKANNFMFQSPIRIGGRQVKSMERFKPKLLLAVDFLFWYGYGAHAGAKRRLALQQLGLRELEKFDCPILVGDYPDMRGAARYMLMPFMIPAPATIAKLNERLRTWAKDRKNVVLYPLSKFAAESKQPMPLVLGDRKLMAPAKYLLQTDGLHPTSLGMALVVHRMGPFVPKLLGDDHPLCKKDYGLKPVVEALDLKDLLPTKPTSRPGG